MTPSDIATDIVILTHNRLDHLIATVDALEQRTPEPIRITVVDNASGPELRNWLADNRDRFHKVILRPTNEHTSAFQHGIDATTSDPYIVTDPDIVVPDLEPSWLARLHGLMERHPDFGLIGIGLDNTNRPPVLDPEVIDPASVVDDEVVEAGVGTVMQMIRRRALLTPYRTDWRTCTDVNRAGWRVGWAKDIRAIHLGWDDYKLHPSHLAKKHLHYGVYREVDLIARVPTMTELALAAPAVAVTREAGIPDASVLELAWNDPVVSAAVPAAVGFKGLDVSGLPFDEGSAGAVVLVDPPNGQGAAAVGAAARVSADVIVAVADLGAFDARTAAEVAPPGWTGVELDGPSDVAIGFAIGADRDPAGAARLGLAALEDSEKWLKVFASASFGASTRRVWVWRRETPLPIPDAVRYDASVVQPWQPVPAPSPKPPRLGPVRRFWKRADVVERARIYVAVRRHASEARS